MEPEVGKPSNDRTANDGSDPGAGGLAQSLSIDDCSGACLPGPGGSTADRLRNARIHELRRLALWLIDRCLEAESPPTRHCLQVLWGVIDALPAHGFIAAFSHPVSHSHLAPQWLEHDPIRRALGLARFLIGAPDVDALDLVLPPEAFPREGLYLPHLHAVLDAGGGPVAVGCDARHVQFTWVDGFSVTLPVEGLDDPLDLGTQRLTLGKKAAGWPILNGLPEILGPPLNLSPQPDPDPSAPEIAELVAGLDLLRQVWPEAYSASRRFFRAAIIEPRPEPYSTSRTLDKLHGAFMASIHDPMQVGDALCHECSHTRLGLFWAIDALIKDDGSPIHPSPWRPDPRPLKGVLDGIHAFVNVCFYYQRLATMLSDPEPAERVFAVQRAKVLQAWEYFAPRAIPTRLGAIFLTELEAAIQSIG